MLVSQSLFYFGTQTVLGQACSPVGRVHATHGSVPSTAETWWYPPVTPALGRLEEEEERCRLQGQPVLYSKLCLRSTLLSPPC